MNIFAPVWTNGAKGYFEFDSYLSKCDINNFKHNDNFNYMTEHLGENQVEHAREYLLEIRNLNLIDNTTINNLINVNDEIGNPVKYKIEDEIIECSPNTIKYIYFGLLNIKYILDDNKNITDVIEIGGGYGGQCVILLKLFELFNININSYTLIDLNNVISFQNKYINLISPQNKCCFVKFEDVHLYKFNINSYLFSSYSLSELNDQVRQFYYDSLFKYISYGLLVWNTQTIDIPKKYICLEKEYNGNRDIFVYIHP